MVEKVKLEALNPRGVIEAKKLYAPTPPRQGPGGEEGAAELKKMGFDQKSLQDEVYRRTSVPYEELNEMEIESIRKAIELGVVPAGRRPVFEEGLKMGGMVPVMIAPDDLYFFVAGGAPGCAFSFDYLRIPPYNFTAVLTKKITGAALTKAGEITVSD